MASVKPSAASTAAEAAAASTAASEAKTAVREIVYPYVKLRKDFGRQPRFIEDRVRHHVNIKPNRHLRKRLRRIRLLDTTIQPLKQLSEASVNTLRPLRVTLGTWHREGGWPKDVNPSDPESVMRQRKKMEKEEAFQLALPEMFASMYKNVRENNSIEMYHEMFSEKWKSADKQKRLPRGVTMHILPDWSKQQRPVNKIDWAPSGIGRVIVSHLPHEFTPSLRDSNGHCYIWEVANPSRPEAMVKSWTTITDIHFHPKDYHSICASCYDGTVQFWDTRVQSKAIASSPSEISHKKPSMGSNWINSKTDTELMSVGIDGQVIWWDIRNLNEHLDQVWLDPEKGSAREEMALPATKLEFETSLPTKFAVGTFDGGLMVLMKKGKSPQDRLLLNYKAHVGPIQAVRRNPMFVKNILTVGDGSFRIFAEDCKDSSIMWSQRQDVLYTHGGWVPSRPSVLGCTRTDGRVDFFDILRDPARPYHVMQVGKMKLTHFSAGPVPNRYVALGTENGDVLLQKLSIALSTFDKKDKPKLAAVFERESHKEKNIEQRHREIRLRKRDKDKKAALQAKIEKEREEFKKKVIAEAQAAGQQPEKHSYPSFKGGKNYDIRFEAKHGEQCVFERKFYRELDEELQKEGLNAWMEYDHLIDVKPEGEENEELDIKSITASDLMVNEDEEDEGHRRNSSAAPRPSGAEAAEGEVSRSSETRPSAQANTTPKASDASHLAPEHEEEGGHQGEGGEEGELVVEQSGKASVTQPRRESQPTQEQPAKEIIKTPAEETAVAAPPEVSAEEIASPPKPPRPSTEQPPAPAAEEEEEHEDLAYEDEHDEAEE